MKLKIGEKELNIKFGYEPTLKGKILSRMAKLEKATGADAERGFDEIEELLLLLPEILLIGLQVHHSDEYGYDYDTEEGKQEQLKKMFSFMDEYCDGKDADLTKLYNDLEEAMLKNGFLKSLFQKEQKKIEQVKETVQANLEVVQNEN